MTSFVKQTNNTYPVRMLGELNKIGFLKSFVTSRHSSNVSSTFPFLGHFPLSWLAWLNAESLEVFYHFGSLENRLLL